MDAAQKIFRFIESKGMPDAEFCALTKIPKSFLSNLRSGKVKMTLTQGIRAAEAMDMTLDYLFDDRQDWPPPPEAARMPSLTGPERKVLQLAHDVSKDDQSLTVAIDRLLLCGYRPDPIPGDFQPPPGRAYEEKEKKKAGPEPKLQPGRKAL